MKKLIFSIITTLTLVCFTYGNNDAYNSRKVQDVSELNKIKEYLKTFGEFETKLNFEEIVIISTKENPKMEMIVINSNDFDEKKPSNFALQVYYPNQTLKSVFYAKTNKGTDIYNVEYLSLTNEVLLSIDIDVPNKQLRARGKKGCGQIVADCVNDAYTNHGWVSVWMIVQSAYLPQTVGVLIIACWDRFC